jgi:autotransporter-associated beta strand protein
MGKKFTPATILAAMAITMGQGHTTNTVDLNGQSGTLSSIRGTANLLLTDSSSQSDFDTGRVLVVKNSFGTRTPGDYFSGDLTISGYSYLQFYDYEGADHAALNGHTNPDQTFLFGSFSGNNDMVDSVYVNDIVANYPTITLGSTTPGGLYFNGTIQLDVGTLTEIILDNNIIVGADNSVINLGEHNTVTLRGTITSTSDAYTLKKMGLGTLMLSGSFTGISPITVVAGNLSCSGPGSLPTGQITLNGGVLTLTNLVPVTYVNAIALNANSTLRNEYGATLSGNITGAYTLTKSGVGTLTLSADNSSAATALTVGAGSLSIGAATNLPTGTITLGGGASLTPTAAFTINNALTLSGNAEISNASACTLGGVLTGAFTLTKSGGGDLTLSNDSSSFSGINVTGGKLIAGAALPAVTLTGGMTIKLNAASLRFALTVSPPLPG